MWSCLPPIQQFIFWFIMKWQKTCIFVLSIQPDNKYNKVIQIIIDVKYASIFATIEPFINKYSSVFSNIWCVLYPMDVMTSVLPLSWYLSYRMAYDNYTCLLHHSIFDGYEYFRDAHPYFISVVSATFVVTPWLPISDKIVPRFFILMTISVYDFYFPYILLFFWFT